MEKIITDAINFWNQHSNTIITALIVFIIGLIFIKFILKIVTSSFKKSSINITVQKFSISIIRVILYVLLITTLLQVFGVPMTSIIAAFSIVGLAVSLAIQTSLSNVAGGVTLLFSKPFKIGDYILYENLEGTVLYISILSTKIVTLDNKYIFIPNSKLTEGCVTNFTYAENRRIDLDVGIGYNDDFKKAISVIEKIIEADPLLITSSENPDLTPFVRVSSLGDSSVNITIKVWTKTSDYLKAKCGILENIKETFDKENISIPFPQMEVSITNKK